MIRVINESFYAEKSEVYGMTLEEVERKLTECLENLNIVKDQMLEVKATWSSLKEDVDTMSFGNYLHGGLREQFKETFADLKKNYDALKQNYNMYQSFKKALTEESDSKTVWVQKDISEGADTDGYVYCGNGGRSWVRADSDKLDTWETEEEALQDGYESFSEEFEYGVDWTVVPLQKRNIILDEDLSSVFDRYYHDEGSRKRNPSMFSYADRLMTNYNIDENNIKGTFNNAPEDIQLRMIELVAPRFN